MKTSILPVQFQSTPPRRGGGANTDDRNGRSNAVREKGEREQITEAIRKNAGSSPRPWGTHPLGGARLDPVRFIPTPVGNATVLFESS